MLNTTHSPFFVVEEFISPLASETFIDYLNVTVPDVDKNGNPIYSTRTDERIQEIVYERILQLVPQLEKHYNIQYRGTHPITVEWVPQGCDGISAHSENSKFVRGKWLRTQTKDLTGVIFLSDYQDKLPFEGEFEVYGGKLEFPQHRFGFNPQRGTLIVFPGAPHFINLTSPIEVGDLFQIRFHISAKEPYLYQPDAFPGNYTTWFK